MAASLWIKTASNLPRHPKLIAAADMLNISRAEMLGRLVMLWIFALEFRQAGIFENAEEVAVAMNWPVSDASRLVAALQLCGGFGVGFVERPRPSDNGRVVLHHWEDFSGIIADSATAQKRKRREYKKEEENAAPSISSMKSEHGAPIPRDANHADWLKKLGVL